MEDQGVKAAADWWARGVGIAAFAASFAALAWNIYNGMRDRSQLKLVEFTVTTRMGFFRVIFTLANAGRRPITIKDFALKSPDGSSFELTPYLEWVNFEDPDEKVLMGPIPEILPQLARRLDEGERCNFVANMQWYPGSLKQPPKRIIAGDATGKAWKFSLPRDQRSQLASLFHSIRASRDRNATLNR